MRKNENENEKMKNDKNEKNTEKEWNWQIWVAQLSFMNPNRVFSKVEVQLFDDRDLSVEM